MANELPPPTAWLVESLRLTVFAEPGAPFDSSKWWVDLVGAQPDSISDQPKQSLHNERGRLDDQRDLILQVQANRIDWVMLPPAQTEAALPMDFLAVGDFPATVNGFATIMRRWLPSCPPVTRLALGGVLLQAQSDRRAGYVLLGSYIPSVTLDPDSSDFSYQINRPRKSTTSIPNLEVNRLTRWAVVLLRTLAVSAGLQAMSVADMARRSACRLEFDINTSQEFTGRIPQGQLTDLLVELSDLALEIAALGDIK